MEEGGSVADPPVAKPAGAPKSEGAVGSETLPTPTQIPDPTLKPEVIKEEEEDAKPAAGGVGSQAQSKKRKLGSIDELRNSTYFKIRSIIRDLRPLFIEVIHAPDFRESKAAHDIRKRQVVFSGYAPRRETSGAEDAHPAYSEIFEVLNENLVGAATKASSSGDSVNKIVFDLLQHGDKGHKYTKGSVAMKIDNWVLLDNFVSKDSSLMDARAKALQSHSKRSKKHMTMRQHRKCGSLDLPKEFHNFSRFKPMHEIWKEDISKILKENREKQLSQTLLVADLHGAFLIVVECKTIAFKGISGIMIRETAKTFGLITQDNRFRVVPKQGSVFVFQAGCWKITLHGDNLSLRNSTT